MFDRLAEDDRLADGKIHDASVDSVTATTQADEKHLLEVRSRELEEERRKFTEAAVKLGKEKAALEVGFHFSHLQTCFRNHRD